MIAVELPMCDNSTLCGFQSRGDIERERLD